ncbi:MAG: patatin-like phospholipase family protein [Chloroflexi bacterium]|nr:patatin-like phospholipase family protein [Chloroflexota bacterium]
MRQKFGLTLGGGGARGAAHIGVLTELERVGLQPDLITGTSMGGLVAALVAAGLSSKDLLHLFEKMNLSQIYALPGSKKALSSNKKVEKLLEEMIGRITFADLKIPLAVVTTDLVSRREVILDEGDVITAVLATIALPVILPAVELNGRTLVDGGLLNNVPFDVARARGATYVLAVDLTNTAPFGTHVDKPKPSTGVLERVLTMTQNNPTWQIISTITDIVTAQSLNTRLALSQPDLLLRPDMSTISLFDFHRWQEAVEAGRTAVLPHLDEIVESVGSKQ